MIRQPDILILVATLAALFESNSVVRTDWQEKSRLADPSSAVTFEKNIAPLLKGNCTPCHFEGGKVYGRLPFDRYETVRKLGKRLNIRLKDEKADTVTHWIEMGFPK